MGNKVSAESNQISAFASQVTKTNGHELCTKCLALLGTIVDEYGDEVDRSGPETSHSFPIDFLPTCVVCARTKIDFECARQHVSFEETLRRTPVKEWSLIWGLSKRNLNGYLCGEVGITARHKRGYTWGIGKFKLFPDGGARGKDRVTDIKQGSVQVKKSPGDYSIITPLNSSTGIPELETPHLDFSSTVGSGAIASINSWIRNCTTKHLKCNHIFGNKGIDVPAEPWFPDRLVRLTGVLDDISNSPNWQEQVSIRIVERSDLGDFSSAEKLDWLRYVSLSHSWGPPPNPSEPLQGRYNDVLTRDKLSAWKRNIPLGNLLPTFQDAIKVCMALGVKHIWIDSLCIVQNNTLDWDAQSAVMADVYKYAYLNIAALTSTSDREGFINNNRDPRVYYGFRIPFSSVLDRDENQTNKNGQRCTLLGGQCSLVWNLTPELPGNGAGNSPLYTRAWVFQERSLARRTLGFAKQGVVWACDGSQRSEHPGEEEGIFEAQQLRKMLQAILDIAPTSIATHTTDTPERAVAAPQMYPSQIVESFDFRWQNAIQIYTQCHLTYQTDKLIAFSAVAREYHNSGLTMQTRYLAGLWEINLPFQIGWITVEGKTTPKRKSVGEKGYMAPSWSWASVEAPVQPRAIFSKGGLVALSDAVGADVILRTDFKFGSVSAGWLRLRGRLNQVSAIGKRSQSLYLTDKATGEDLWFSSDTVEGYEIVSWRRNIQKLVWLPLTARFDRFSVECKCLVLAEVSKSSEGDEFIRPGEKVYRRLGSGNFGCLPSLLKQKPLILGLGSYPETSMADGNGGRLEAGFKRNESDFEEFVLV